jgi:hypothetical protein
VGGKVLDFFFIRFLLVLLIKMGFSILFFSSLGLYLVKGKSIFLFCFESLHIDFVVKGICCADKF